jgi:hypothetical protein
MTRYCAIAGLLAGILATALYAWIDGVARTTSQSTAAKAIENQQTMVNEFFKGTFAGIQSAETELGKLRQQYDSSLERFRKEFESSLATAKADSIVKISSTQRETLERLREVETSAIAKADQVRQRAESINKNLTNIEEIQKSIRDSAAILIKNEDFREKVAETVRHPLDRQLADLRKDLLATQAQTAEALKVLRYLQEEQTRWKLGFDTAIDSLKREQDTVHELLYGRSNVPRLVPMPSKLAPP